MDSEKELDQKLADHAKYKVDRAAIDKLIAQKKGEQIEGSKSGDALKKIKEEIVKNS